MIAVCWLGDQSDSEKQAVNPALVLSSGKVVGRNSCWKTSDQNLVWGCARSSTWERSHQANMKLHLHGPRPLEAPFFFFLAITLESWLYQEGWEGEERWEQAITY